MSVGPAPGDGLADDSAAGFELPQELAVTRVDGLEPPFHRPVEDDVAGRGQSAGPDREALVDRPDLLALHGVPGVELAAVAVAGRRVHLHVRADVRRAGDVIRLHAF